MKIYSGVCSVPVLPVTVFCGVLFALSGEWLIMVFGFGPVGTSYIPLVDSHWAVLPPRPLGRQSQASVHVCTSHAHIHICIAVYPLSLPPPLLLWLILDFLFSLHFPLPVMRSLICCARMCCVLSLPVCWPLLPWEHPSCIDVSLGVCWLSQHPPSLGLLPTLSLYCDILMEFLVLVPSWFNPRLSWYLPYMCHGCCQV